MILIDLYMTSACHLCEQAASTITNSQLPIQLIMIDIADDESLLEQYGSRIPVIKLHTSKQELDWPFNVEQVVHFLKSA
jgi:hypothetical protein